LQLKDRAAHWIAGQVDPKPILQGDRRRECNRDAPPDDVIELPFAGHDLVERVIIERE